MILKPSSFMAWSLAVAILRAADDDGYGVINEPASGSEGTPPPPDQRIKLCAGHPDIDDLLRRGAPSYELPSTHPTVHPLLRPYIGDHDNIDRLLQRGKHYDDGGHPKIEPYVKYNGLKNTCYDYSNYKNATGCPVNASVTHPSIDESIENGTPFPTNHPKIHDLLKKWMSPNHRNVDDLLAAGTKLPFGHPPVDPYLCKTWGEYKSSGDGCATDVSFVHPSVDDSIATGEKVPYDHPHIDFLLRAWMPLNHSNIDELLASQTPLPPGHPLIDPYLCFGKKQSGCVDVYNGHPEVDTRLRDGEQLPDGHPKVHGLFGNLLPDGHGDCDEYIKQGTPIPDWHPNIDDYLCERSIISAGIVLAVGVTLIFVLLVITRCTRTYFCCGGCLQPKKYDKVPQGKVSREKIYPVDTTKPEDRAMSGVILGDDSVSEGHELSAITCTPHQDQGSPGALDSCRSEELELSGSPSPYILAASEEIQDIQSSELPRRNMQLHAMEELNAKHRDPELYDYAEYKNAPIPPDGIVHVPGHQIMDEKLASVWERLYVVCNNRRVPYFNWTFGNVATVLLYLVLNVLCLIIAPDNHLGRGWGSLAVCNMMLLVIPACRNSIISLGLGISFDRIIWLHRFIGRFAVGCALVHGYYYINTYYTQRSIFLTGVGALGCGVLIFVTSMNFFRREYFNLFFWSHYSFIAMLVLVYLHVPQTKPFIIVAVVLYLLDKFLRCVWMLWPRTTLAFKLRSDTVALVRFPKNPITRVLGLHEVGQYYFVNFPELSLTEWHPFSVSSGPRENCVELNIRDLGDHTKRIVGLAKQKEKDHSSALICIDGPYGQQSFNYRRYRVILLAAGGIGITPIIGMLKDVYSIDLAEEHEHLEAPHAIDTIFLAWVMPRIEDYELFREELEDFMRHAKASHMPNLVPLIYITRSKYTLSKPFIAGRPNIGNIYQQLCKDRPVNQAGLVFACGPQPLVSELWDKSIQETMKGRLIDFHHEIFEF